MSFPMTSTSSQASRLLLRQAPFQVESQPEPLTRGSLATTVKSLGLMALLTALAVLAISGLLPIVLIIAALLLPALVPLLPLVLGLLASEPAPKV